MVSWGNGLFGPSTSLRSGFSRPQSMFGEQQGSSWAQTPWQQQRRQQQPMSHLAGWRGQKPSLFPRQSGQPPNAPARAAATARDGNAAIAEEWNAAQGNSASRDLFRQRHGDWQPQASGGMLPSALAHGELEQRHIAEQAEQERRQMLAELQQRQQRVAGQVSQTPLERTRQWLNQVNGSTSPMAPAQSSLFSTPIPYGNSSAEDWLRTYG